MRSGQIWNPNIFEGLEASISVQGNHRFSSSLGKWELSSFYVLAHLTSQFHGSTSQGACSVMFSVS